MTVCAAVTRRLLDIGYKDIHLGTEDFRLPAIKTYLKLGYIPFIYAIGMNERWADICDKLGWPFTPEARLSHDPDPRPDAEVPVERSVV